MFRIERAQPADASNIAAFATRTFVTAYGHENTPDHVAAYVAAAFDVDEIHEQLASSDTLYLLGYQLDKLVAYVKLAFEQPIAALSDSAPAQLERIYVDAGQQGSGIGAEMLAAAIEAARSRGATSVWLSAWEQNTRAHAFYRHHGFAVAGKTHFMLGPERQEDLIMAYELSRPETPQATES